MTTITLEEALAHLKELIEQKPGEELIIEDGGRPVARLIVEKQPPRRRPGPGLCKGIITILSDDDEHLNDFAEYMP